MAAGGADIPRSGENCSSKWLRSATISTNNRRVVGAHHMVGTDRPGGQLQKGAVMTAWRTRSTHQVQAHQDRKSTRLNSSHVAISYAVFCLKKKTYQSHV